MKPSGSAAQTVTHMRETRRLQVTEEKLLFKVVQRRMSVQMWGGAVKKMWMKRRSFINNSAIGCLCDSSDSTSMVSLHHSLYVLISTSSS